ncbi:MAG: integral rane protein terc [Verrucomicrobiales bacterium]|nr:integral rane protein terc [Verrucomicrobiales bacterium]
MFDAIPVLAIVLPGWSDISTALPVILSLVIIEGLLSVDNALAIAALAGHLPEAEQQKALRYGIIGAYGFRGLCMWGAAWIIANPWLKIVGAAYLIHLMASHFSGGKEGGGDDDDAEGGKKRRGFWMTVLAIEILDLTLSVDNVVAAVAIDTRLWVVCAGVFIGILALRFLAGYCIRLITRFPILEHTAFLLIGFVGCILIVELLQPSIHVSAFQKFLGIIVIIVLTLLYEPRPKKIVESPTGFQKLADPVLKAARFPLKIYSLITGTILGILAWPFRLLIGLFQNKTAGSGA